MARSGNNKNATKRRPDEISCVQLTKDAKKRLDGFAEARRETYENIITRLMDRAENEEPCGEMMSGENESE